MMRKVRHVLGISGGKDSAALAIFLKRVSPELNIEYYFCDTGKELDETYAVVNSLEVFLGKKIIRLTAAENTHLDTAFDHFLKYKTKFLPSSFNRWCTKNLKLDPFEKWIGEDQAISYVGIRGDEDREGYISKKGNIQSIFPFRRNIWSEDVITRVLKNDSIDTLLQFYYNTKLIITDRIKEVIVEPLSPRNRMFDKLDSLLSISTSTFNEVVFQFLRKSHFPVGALEQYSLLQNEDNLNRDDIFQILTDSGIGIPKYYQKVEFEIDGEKGYYSRSRSGCFFCFYQQKIEWVWLYEQHPELFIKAMEYEKDGYTWHQDEPLSDLIRPERIAQIKREYINRTNRNITKSPYLLDILEESEGEGCAACFI